MVTTHSRQYPLSPAPLPPVSNPPAEVEPEGMENEPALEPCEDEQQVSNRALPKDASKLPSFQGDEGDSQCVESFLKSLRR
jgi:hypothetical protein